MNNKISIGALSLGFTYAGCFFGAGFVSGQELWQFFGAFGITGYIGIILAVGLFFLFGIMLVRAAQMSGKGVFDEVIIPDNNKLLRKLLGAITVFLMFGIVVVMTAGAGSLINTVFDIPRPAGCFLFTVVICLAAMRGISGIVKVFSSVVPILVIATLVICITAVSKYGFNFQVESHAQNPLLGSWWTSAINYVSYNIISLIGAIIPVGACVRKTRTAYSGILFGCFMALSVAVGILFAVSTMISSVQTELPMLDVAFALNRVFGYIYSILLLFAMFGTSLASLVSTVVYIDSKIEFASQKRSAVTICLGAVSFICSLAGFGALVGTVYPVFGYIGFAVLFFIARSYYIHKKKNSGVS